LQKNCKQVLETTTIYIFSLLTIQDYNMTTTIPAINEEKLGQFMQKVLYDFGGAASAI